MTLDRTGFTELSPLAEGNIEEIVTFYNDQIARAKAVGHHVLWSEFTAEQVKAIVHDTDSDFLVMRTQAEGTIGAVVGSIIINTDFAAWAPQELLPPKPLHFAKFCTSGSSKFGRRVLWPAFIDYCKATDVTALYAECYDLRKFGLDEDILRNYYTSRDIGMEWHGTVTFTSPYYGEVVGDEPNIGNGRTLNRFVYEIAPQPT